MSRCPKCGTLMDEYGKLLACPSCGHVDDTDYDSRDMEDWSELEDST